MTSNGVNSNNNDNNDDLRILLNMDPATVAINASRDENINTLQQVADFAKQLTYYVGLFNTQVNGGGVGNGNPPSNNGNQQNQPQPPPPQQQQQQQQQDAAAAQQEPPPHQQQQQQQQDSPQQQQEERTANATGQQQQNDELVPPETDGTENREEEGNNNNNNNFRDKGEGDDDNGSNEEPPPTVVSNDLSEPHRENMMESSSSTSSSITSRGINNSPPTDTASTQVSRSSTGVECTNSHPRNSNNVRARQGDDGVAEEDQDNNIVLPPTTVSNDDLPGRHHLQNMESSSASSNTTTSRSRSTSNDPSTPVCSSTSGKYRNRNNVRAQGGDGVAAEDRGNDIEPPTTVSNNDLTERRHLQNADSPSANSITTTSGRSFNNGPSTPACSSTGCKLGDGNDNSKKEKQIATGSYQQKKKNNSATATAAQVSAVDGGDCRTAVLDVNKLTVGQRIEILWPEDGVYYPGTITQVWHGKRNKYVQHLIMYDDGDHEWIKNLSREKFNLLNDVNPNKTQSNGQTKKRGNNRTSEEYDVQEGLSPKRRRLCAIKTEEDSPSTSSSSAVDSAAQAAVKDRDYSLGEQQQQQQQHEGPKTTKSMPHAAQLQEAHPPTPSPAGYKGTLEESQLQRSVGRTRKVLNQNLSKLGLTAMFGQCVVSRKGSSTKKSVEGVVSKHDSKISHLTFNAQWNDLPYNQHQILQWWVGSGPLRLKLASPLDPSRHPQHPAIPIFWAEKLTTRGSGNKMMKSSSGAGLCHYIGHFRCIRFDAEIACHADKQGVVVLKGKARQALLEFAFVRFDTDLANNMALIEPQMHE